MKTKTKSIILKIKAITSVLFLFFAFQAGIISASEITAENMIALTNQSRTENGLSTLVVSDKLMAAAEAKAGDMFKFQYFDHYSPGGISPWHWIKSAGYEYHFAGENLAIDFISAEGAQKAFMESSSHRENILNVDFSEIGIAVKRGVFQQNDSILIVVEFASPQRNLQELYSKAVLENQEVKIDLNTNKFKSGENGDEEKSKLEYNKNDKSEIAAVNIKLNDREGDSGEESKKNDESNEMKLENLASRKTEEKNVKKEISFILFFSKNINPVEKVYAENIFWKNPDRSSDAFAFSKF